MSDAYKLNQALAVLLSVRRSMADGLDEVGPDLMVALAGTIATIEAIYSLADKANDLGGATSINGLAACHGLLSSMKRNKNRVERDVLTPARKALEKAVGEQP